MMLVGEPGIGKTRTAQELGTYARVRGARVLVGRSYEGEGAPPYWPWLQMARAYIHDADPETVVSDMGPGASDIAQVMADLQDLIPGLAGRVAVARAGAGALPLLRQHHDLPQERRAAGAARPLPRRPALGGRARRCGCSSSSPASCPTAGCS